MKRFLSDLTLLASLAFLGVVAVLTAACGTVAPTIHPARVASYQDGAPTSGVLEEVYDIHGNLIGKIVSAAFVADRERWAKDYPKQAYPYLAAPQRQPDGTYAVTNDYVVDHDLLGDLERNGIK